LKVVVEFLKKIKAHGQAKGFLSRPFRLPIPRHIPNLSPFILLLAVFLMVEEDGISSLLNPARSHASRPIFLLRDIYPTFPKFDEVAGGRQVAHRGPFRIIYTIDPVLQSRVEEVFRKSRPPFGAFVALQPKSGKVLALADLGQECLSHEPVWQGGTYPAASIFKLVTAAGALEEGLLRSQSLVSFKGNQYRLGPQKLRESKDRDQRTHFDEALGKSNNVAFGRIASNLLGSRSLRNYSEAFGFNQAIPFDYPLETSKAIIPEESYALARCGAGFGAVTLNPVHAAMIAACIANRGVMMKPYLIERISQANGRLCYLARPEIFARPIQEKTARDLGWMMVRTVEDGTAAKIFHRQGKLLLRKKSVSGKTGSLSGDHPPGIYDWFVGFAPVEDPQIAFSAMVINHERGKVKGAYVAEEALKTFFRGEIH
jgi:peptidoglycan glycosyltransferase